MAARGSGDRPVGSGRVPGPYAGSGRRADTEQDEETMEVSGYPGLPLVRAIEEGTGWKHRF